MHCMSETGRGGRGGRRQDEGWLETELELCKRCVAQREAIKPRDAGMPVRFESRDRATASNFSCSLGVAPDAFGLIFFLTIIAYVQRP